ncbi:hypothetical protein LTR27_009336 [Elasticomyces elasticus]|nr:hypothetical protein LTR27_009336 [Elasticomyces elasticus]
MSGIPYQALDASRMEIRVLDLLPGWYRSPVKCRLRTVSIAGKDNMPYYAGLSYTWGAPLPSKTISLSVDGKEYFRGNWPEPLPDERASQVSFMGEVYSRASTVYIWLGTTVHPNSSRHELASVYRKMMHLSFIVSHAPRGLIDFASRLLSEVRQRWRSIGFHMDFELLFLKAYWEILLMGLSATPYRIEKALRGSIPCWTERAWVLQEFALSSSAQIFFDRTKLPHERYRLYAFEDFLPKVCESSGVLSKLLRRFDGKNDHGQVNDFGPRQGLLVLARNAAVSQTSNPHDKVFALLGMVREEEAREIVVDYNVPFWVTCARATYASAKHNLDERTVSDARYARLNVLEFASWAGDSPSSFPSWVADFSTLTPQSPYERFGTSMGWPGSEDHYDFSLSSDLRCLTTYGVMFGSVATSFTLYSRLNPDSDDSCSNNAHVEHDYYTNTWLTTRDSVPAVQATLLAELTSLALRNHEPVATSVRNTSELQAGKLSSLVLHLEKQQKHRRVKNEDAL